MPADLRPLEDSLFAEYTDLNTGARIRVTDSFVTIEKRIEGVRRYTCIPIDLLGTVAVVASALVERRRR